MRNVTYNICEAVDDGSISWERLARMALDHMGEDQVLAMADSNVMGFDYLIEDEEVTEEVDITLNKPVD
jgi:hypothetical protein